MAMGVRGPVSPLRRPAITLRRSVHGDGGLPSLGRMEVRIGVTQSPRELSVEVSDDTDRDELRSKIDAALSGAVDVLWLVDKKQRDVAVMASKIAYVEIGNANSERRVGFGG